VEDDGREAVIGSVDERLSERNLGSVSRRGRRGSSLYGRLAWRGSKHGGRR
jgi:hypothetical protein